MSTPGENEPTDLYARLGVRPDATAAEITAAYRRRALALHPDSAPDGSDSTALQGVIAAYRVLSHPAQRREYDQRNAPRTALACAVCKGSGWLRTPCPACGGAGIVLMGQLAVDAGAQCPRCAGRRYRRTLCGACAATGRQ